MKWKLHSNCIGQTRQKGQVIVNYEVGCLHSSSSLLIHYTVCCNLSTRKIQGRCSESSQASGIKQHFLIRYSIIFSLEHPKNQATVVTCMEIMDISGKVVWNLHQGASANFCPANVCTSSRQKWNREEFVYIYIIIYYNVCLFLLVFHSTTVATAVRCSATSAQAKTPSFPSMASSGKSECATHALKSSTSRKLLLFFFLVTYSHHL